MRSGRRVKTPTVLQMEAVECGAASLGMILGYYGRWVSLADLRVLTGVSRDGSNALSILKAARSFNLDARGFRRTAEEVLAGRFPVIVFWAFEHFLVVEGCRGDVVYLNDPAIGPLRITRKEFAEAYSGVTLEFEPTDRFERGGHWQATWPLIAERLRGAGPPIALVFLCAVPLGLLAIAVPAFTRIFVDNVLVRELAGWLRPLLSAFAFALIAQATLTAVQQRMLAKLQNWLAITQSSRFVWHLMTLPLAYFSQRRAGDFAQRLQANARIAQLIGGELGGAALQSVVAAATVIAMTLYQPLLALVAIAAAVLSGLGLYYVSRLRANAVERMRADQALLYAQSITTIQNIEHVKSIGAEDEAFQKWAGQQASLVNVEQRLSVINAATDVAPMFLFGLANAAVFGFGGLLVMRAELSLGTFTAFLMLMSGFTLAIQQLVNITGELQQGRGDLLRLHDTYLQDPDWRHQPAPARVRTGEIGGRLTLRALTFGYDHYRPPLIESFDLEVEPGRSVALVGRSGSGKSTIGRLASGLLTPWSGEVAIDGVPLQEWDRDQLAASLAVVEQNVVLFDGTVRDNVTLWQPSIPQQAVFSALKDADLIEKVMSLQGTLEAPLAEGGRNLSGGQRQRLDLARALVHRPRLLVLDEATSALDAISEREILHTVRRLGCTTIMIAHRLSTIRDCDEIIVLHDGKVAERGRHEALIMREGAYAELVRDEE